MTSGRGMENILKAIFLNWIARAVKTKWFAEKTRQLKIKGVHMHKIISLQKRRRRQQSHPGQSGSIDRPPSTTPARSLCILWLRCTVSLPTSPPFQFHDKCYHSSTAYAPLYTHIPFTVRTQSIRFETSTKKPLNQYKRKHF